MIPPFAVGPVGGTVTGGAPAAIQVAGSADGAQNAGTATGSDLYSGIWRGWVGSARSTAGVSPAVPSLPANTSGPYITACSDGSSGVGSRCSAIGNRTTSCSPSLHVRLST